MTKQIPNLEKASDDAIFKTMVQAELILCFRYSQKLKEYTDRCNEILTKRKNERIGL